ncbi:MAG TPA: glycosyltransferase [Immundisolibacter sp.]|nr:glycosyltransferase [Immundisolibacter sp.]
MVSISVVLACHNSTQRLPQTLAHLAALQAPAGMAWEVLVVDNASTDDTAQVAVQLWAAAGAPVPLRVVAEPRPGVMYARWTGIRAAHHAIVSFVDDDNWVDPNWLFVVDEVFSTQPRVAAVGCCSTPVFETAEPPWFAAVQEMYACGPQAPAAGPVPDSRGHLFSAGLSLRRAALIGLEADGFVPKNVGRTGASLASGEDTEMCHALAAAGWTLWYEPRLRMRHYMPAARLTLAYARRLSFELGRAATRLEPTRPRSGWRRHAARLIRLRPVAALWYASSWAFRAAPLPGRKSDPLGASYQLGRLTQVLQGRRAG